MYYNCTLLKVTRKQLLRLRQIRQINPAFNPFISTHNRNNNVETWLQCKKAFVESKCLILILFSEFWEYINPFAWT